MKQKQLAVAAIFSIFSFGSSLAHAASTIFSDNFDNYLPDQLNWAPPASSGWTVIGGGTVDLIGAGGGRDLLPGNGSYIDLDGSTRNPGRLLHSFDLLGSTTYTLSFDLAGSQRGTEETVNVHFGNISASYTLASADPFSTRTLNFTTGNSGTYHLSYENRIGEDNIGVLLDNVSVSAIPEPEMYALMLAGLAMIGWAASSLNRSS